MKKMVLISALLLLILSSLIAVESKSDSVDIKLSYKPIYTVRFASTDKGADMSGGPASGASSIEAGTPNEFGSNNEGKDPEYDPSEPSEEDAKTLRFYVEGTTNYPMSSYPKTTVSWSPLTMVGTSTAPAPTLGVDVYVASAKINDATMDSWFDGARKELPFREKDSKSPKYESSVTFSGLEDAELSVTGEHTFYMRFVALVPYSEYEAATEGQYMTTFQLTVDGA